MILNLFVYLAALVLFPVLVFLLFGYSSVSRPQEPVSRPYPHRELRLSGGEKGFMLAGELVLPEGNGPFPAVVLLAGSGAQDRDEAVAGHRPFLVLSDALARAGIASLRYDKRGAGESQGQFAAATITDFARDAAAALDWLARHPETDASRLGYVGHSEGGLVALVAAEIGKCARPARIVLLAGPGLVMDQVVTRQVADISRISGASEREITTSNAALAAAFGKLRAAANYRTARDGMREALSAVGPELRRAILDAFASPWGWEAMHLDPTRYLGGFHGPVLALFGANDVQVSPKPNAAAMESYLRHFSSRVEILDGLNHLFQPSQTGAPADYEKIETTLAPEVLTKINSFILEGGSTAPEVHGPQNNLSIETCS